jgi:hypothetical protein
VLRNDHDRKVPPETITLVVILKGLDAKTNSRSDSALLGETLKRTEGKPE